MAYSFGTLLAVAHDHGYCATCRYFPSDRKCGLAATGEDAAGNPDRIAIAPVAIALFGDNGDAPRPS
jgi:hypothetical protein